MKFRPYQTTTASQLGRVESIRPTVMKEKMNCGGSSARVGREETCMTYQGDSLAELKTKDVVLFCGQLAFVVWPLTRLTSPNVRNTNV